MTRMVHGKFYIQAEEIYAYIRFYSMLTYVFAPIAINMATKFTNTYFLNSAVNLTSNSKVKW